MPEVQTQPTQQSKSTVSSNLFFSSKPALLLVSIWLLIILTAAFYFLRIFEFASRLPQGTGTASFYLSTVGLNLSLLTVFALINGVIVGLGLKYKKFTKIFVKFIDPILLLLGVSGIVSAYSLPCEGLGCITNGFLLMVGAFALVSVLTHAPILLLILGGSNRKLILIITAVFVSLMILVPSITYAYLSVTLQKKTETGIAQAQKELDFIIFKPNYLPDKNLTKQFEDVNKNLSEYSFNNYYEQVDGRGGYSLRITQTTPKGRMEKLLMEQILSEEGRQTTIDGNPAAISTILFNKNIEGSRFRTTIIWINSGTEIELIYDGIGAEELIESEAVKIAESMESI